MTAVQELKSIAPPPPPVYSVSNSAVLANGEIAVLDQTGTDFAVQLYNEQGTLVGQVADTGLDGGGSNPQIVASKTGGFLIYKDLEDNAGDTVGETYDSQGNQTTPLTTLISGSLKADYGDTITATPNGGYNVFWCTSANGGNSTTYSGGASIGEGLDVYNETLSSSLVASTPVGLSGTYQAPGGPYENISGDQRDPGAAQLSNGNIVDTFVTTRYDNPIGYYYTTNATTAIGMTLNGGPVEVIASSLEGDATPTNPTNTNSPIDLIEGTTVTQLTDGQYLVTFGRDASSFYTEGLLFNADGSAASSEFNLLTRTFKQYNYYVSVVALPSGGFAVGYVNPPPPQGGVPTQNVALFSSSGTLLQTIVLNQPSTYQLGPPILNVLPDGVLTAEDPNGHIYEIAPTAPSYQAEQATITPGPTTASFTAGPNGTGALAGDSDPAGGTLSVSTIQGSAANVGASVQGTYGELTLNSDGSYSYVADQGVAIVSAADGVPIEDQFSYVISNGNGGLVGSVLTEVVSLAAGGTETVTNPTGNATYTIGATTLTLNETAASTYGGVIQDGSSGNVGGNVVVTGAAPLTLTGGSTYTGRTSVSGTLALSGTASIHSSSKVALTTAGATFDISGASAGEVVNKLGGIAGTVADLGGQNLKIKVQGGTIDTFSGVIQDGGLSGGTGGSLTLGGTGELNLTAAETYTGATTLNAGTLALTGSGSIAASSGLSLQSSLGANSIFDMSGETAASIGTLSGVAGALVDLGAGTLTVNEATAGTFAGTIQDGGSSSGTGGSLVVAGAAALTLTGAEAYMGKTSVSGTLDLSGSASIRSSSKVALTKAGATFDISGTTTAEVVNKLGGIAGTVTDLGSQNLKIKVQTGTVDTFAGTIQDGGAAGGSGGSITLGGLGELSLTAASSYTGGTAIDGGTLDIAALGAAGTGTITFANTQSTATLEIDAAALSASSGAYSFGNKIAGATSASQVIDLTSLAYVQGSTSATVVNGTSLVVNDGSATVTLTLAAAQAKSSFTTASDGHGGTLVYDPPAAKHAPATAKIDTRWIEAAMADFGGVTGNGHAHAGMHDPYGPDVASAFENHHERFDKVVRGA